MAPKKETTKKTIGVTTGDRPNDAALKEEKMKALESALNALNKTYGKGAVMKFSDAAAIQNLQVITTGNL